MQQLPPIAPLWSKLEENQPTEVLQVLQEHGFPQQITFQTLRGLALYEAQQFTESVEVLKEVLVKTPENPVAQLFLILSLFCAGQDQEAGKRLLHETTVLPHRHWLREFVRLFWPLRFQESFTRLGRVTKTEDFQDPFASEYSKWQAIPVEERRALSTRGGTGIGEAASLVGKTATASGRNALFIRRLGERYEALGEKRYLSGNKSAAMQLMERAIEVDPSNTTSLTNVAFMRLVFFQREEALQLLDEDLRERFPRDEEGNFPAGPPSDELLICYAWALHENGRHRDALRLLSTVHPEGPEDLGAHFYASVCWLMLGKEKEFRDAFAVASTEFFIDTWEQLLVPFIDQTGRWLEAGGRKSAE